ncbi:MAG: hypothetical protein SGBAC_004716 [Bacillariaceae sp.]
MNSQNEQQTVPVSTKTASGVTPKWSFCAGDIAEAPEEENDDFCWNTASAVPINWDAEESSIMGEDEFAEDVVLEVCDEDKVPSPSRSPPSPEDNLLLVQGHVLFSNFKAKDRGIPRKALNKRNEFGTKLQDTEE